MTTSEQTNEIAAAMVKAQAMMKPAVKDAVNPHFRSRYADLTSVWDACRGPLTANGITVWQDVTTRGILGSKGEFDLTWGIGVTTRLSHVSGQWVEFGPLVVPLTKPDAHGVGSATSYGKRYALAAAVGIVSDDDDDGNAVAMPAAAQSAPQTPSAPPTGVTVGTAIGTPPPGAFDPYVEPPHSAALVAAQGVANIAARERMPTPPERKAQESGNGAMLTISVAQQRRLYAIAKSRGWEDGDLKNYLKFHYRIEHSRDIPRKQYDAIIAELQKGQEHWK